MPKNPLFRLLLGMVGLFVLMFAAVLFVGSRVEDTQTAHGSVWIDLSPEDTWTRLADVKQFPRSALSVSQVFLDEPEGDLPRWREVLSQSTISWRTTELVAPTHRVDAGGDSEVPMSAVWTWDLAPEEDGTRLDVTIATTVSDGSWMGPIFKLVLKVGATRVALESYLKNTMPDFDAEAIRWN